MRRLLIALTLLLVLAAACGDDGDTTSDSPTTTETPEETTTTETPEETTTTETPEETTTTEAPVETTTTLAEEPAPETVAVTLEEFSVTVDGAVPAGTVTFMPTNIGEFPHELGIAVGTSYDDFPKLGNGAIDEEALGADVLAKTDRIPAGESTSLEIELAPGDYVLFCNIAVGPNSHAANGQTLSISVS